MFSGTAWFDTCCTTTPEPECTFPAGFSQYDNMGTGSAFVIGDYIWSNTYVASSVSYIYKTNISTFETTTFTIETLYGALPTALTYNASENALYWGAGATEATDPTYLIKFSLVTNSIEAVEQLSLYESAGGLTNAAVIFVNDYLYVTRGGDTIEKRNAADLSLIDTFSDAGASMAIPTKNSYVVTSDHKILM
jgi:hypothetical protein